MGAIADMINVGAMVVNPTAPITGAFVKQFTSGFHAKPPEEKSVRVTAEGSGATYAEALANAKVRALEKVSGVFVISSTKTVDQQQRSATSEYYGGVIRSWEEVDSTKAFGVFTVTIETMIVSGKNNIVNNQISVSAMSDQIGELQELKSRQQQFVRAFEDQPMYAVSTGKSSFTVRGNMVELTIPYHISWSPKFVDDIRTYAKMAGKVVDVGDKRSAYAVCFGTTARWIPQEQCYDLAASIPQLESSARVQIVVSYKGNLHTETYDVPFNQQQNAFRYVTYAGSWLYHTSSGRRVNYARGLVIFDQGVFDGSQMIRIPLTSAQQITDVTVAITTKSEQPHAADYNIQGDRQ